MSNDLATRFRTWAFTEVEETSPLYHRLALEIAEEPALLALAGHAPAGQPPANLFLAAVHFLLLKGMDDPLAGFYPSLVAQAQAPEVAFPAFRAFCLANGEAIAQLLATRLVQTNELRRCAYLLPALSRTAELAGGRPLALVEIGSSAGLNLLFDRYTYAFDIDGRSVQAGAVASTVFIDSRVEVAEGTFLPLSMPAVASRLGIDLKVLDLADPDDALWLRALIWPEHAERAARLAHAVALWRATPPQLLEGDAVAQLPGVLDALPPSAAPVVIHTHVMNQFTPEQRHALDDAIRTAAYEQTVYRIGNDFGGGSLKHYPLRLMGYSPGGIEERVIAHVDGHGRWIRWSGGNR
jgi:hypothetical protein